MTRKAKYKEEDGHLLLALYYHRLPQLETSYPLLHGKASGCD
jgi:hypothetical protein